jgi:hypothetical protein
MHKVHGWETFLKGRAGLSHNLVLGPLFWECLTLGFYPTHNLFILYINSLRASVRPTRQFRVLIRRRNRPGQSDGRTDGQTDGRTDRQIFYGRTGPDRRPLYNFDQRSLVSLSVSGQSVCDHWTQRKVTGKR